MGLASGFLESTGRDPMMATQVHYHAGTVDLDHVVHLTIAEFQVLLQMWLKSGFFFV